MSALSSPLDTLIKRAGHRLVGEFDERALLTLGDDAACLVPLLSARNGFYDTAGGLHVLPAGREEGAVDIVEWNREGLWKEAYGDISHDFVFFAEDVFGTQFGVRDQKFVCFDAETGDVDLLAESLDEWVQCLLADYEALTGAPLAEEWRAKHGRIPSGSRLLPKQPFVLGGEFVLDNLYLADSVRGMRMRGEMAVQLRDLPDGSPVEVRIVD